MKTPTLLSNSPAASSSHCPRIQKEPATAEKTSWAAMKSLYCIATQQPAPPAVDVPNKHQQAVNRNIQKLLNGPTPFAVSRPWTEISKCKTKADLQIKAFKAPICVTVPPCRVQAFESTSK